LIALKWGCSELLEYLFSEEIFIFKVQRKKCPLKLLFVEFLTLCHVLEEER
jgi:hypothetical protein